jgi:uncharacterized protein (DUF58 family)
VTRIGRGDFSLFGWSLTGTLLLAFWLRSGLLLAVGLLLGAVGLASTVWGRYALSRITYHRQFARHRVFVGETVELTLALTNRKVLPVTYLRVEDAIPEELEIHSRRLQFYRVGKGLLQMLYSLAWYQKVIRHYQVTPLRRGYFVLGPASLYGGDPFGYVMNTAELPETEALIVYPKIIGLQSLGMPVRRPFGDLKSSNRLFEDPLRFAGVREYQPGDPLNRIHWKASAVAGQWQVKLLDPSSNPGICLFLNTWAFDRAWQGVDGPAFEAACTVAASIANWAQENGAPAGIFANGLTRGWGLNLTLPPARGPQVLTAILEGLARLDMPSRTTFSDLLLENLPRLGYGTSVVVIATRQVSEDLAGALLSANQSGRPVTLVLVGGNGTALPPLPGVRVYRVSGEEALHAAVLA